MKSNSRILPNDNKDTVTPTPGFSGRSSSIISTDSLELLERRLLKNFAQMINDRFSEFEDLVYQRIEQIATSVNSEVSKLREELDAVKRELSETRFELEDIRRGNRLTDAVIIGVPCTDNENPQKILEEISDLVSHKLSPYATAFRAKTHTDKRKHSNRRKNPPLIAKFSSANEQRIFLQKFKTFGAVQLNKFSSTFVSDSRVYAYESLTRCSQQTLHRALALKRTKAIHSAFTRQGVVHIKMKYEEAPIMVPNVNALNELLLETNTQDA